MIINNVRLKKFFLYLMAVLIFSMVLFFASRESKVSILKSQFQTTYKSEERKLTEEEFNYYWKQYGLKYIQEPNQWLGDHLKKKEDAIKYQEDIDGVLKVWSKNITKGKNFNNLNLSNQIALKTNFLKMFQKAFFSDSLKNIANFNDRSN